MPTSPVARSVLIAHGTLGMVLMSGHAALLMTPPRDAAATASLGACDTTLVLRMQEFTFGLHATKPLGLPMLADHDALLRIA